MHADDEAFHYVPAGEGFFEFVLRPAQNDQPLVVYVVLDYIQKAELLGLAARDCNHIYAESALQIGILQQHG